MKTLFGLFALLASIVLTLAVGAAEAKTPTPPPPIASLPPAGDTAPPADAIVDSIAPITSCGGWHLASNYGGRWATDSSWWEYLCGACIPGCATNESTSFRYDYYVWDGSRPVYYGQWYTESNMDGDGDPCSYWWDDATSEFYGPYACTREIDANPTASFTINCSALRCNVDGSGSADSDGTIAYYLWYFGDFTDQSSGISAGHLFARGGSYTVTLAVTDDLGLVGYAEKTVTVGAPNAASSGSFTVSCSGLNCSFDGNGSAESDGTIRTPRAQAGAVGVRLQSRDLAPVPGDLRLQGLRVCKLDLLEPCDGQLLTMSSKATDPHDLRQPHKARLQVAPR